jgi:hypothetical protein
MRAIIINQQALGRRLDAHGDHYVDLPKGPGEDSLEAVIDLRDRSDI